LPGDPLPRFHRYGCRSAARDGLQNEKDHPEVAPSQFEINYTTAKSVAAADQIQLYKLICRQVATKLGMTASFLPKAGRRRQRKRHAHQRLGEQKRQGTFWEPKGEEQLSAFGWKFVDRILTPGTTSA